MCDFLARLFGGGSDNSAAEAATATARAKSQAALEQQVSAKNSAMLAGDANSENTRLASEAAMKRLAAGAMFGIGGQGAAVNPNAVVTRELFGS